MTEPEELNSHLAVVFDEWLPLLEQRGLRYWVYGGVAIAGIAGRFLRRNADVDIYVLETEFHSVRSLLAERCASTPDWRLEDAPALRGRPKLNICVRDVELMSVVPVYETDRGIEFRANTLVLLPLPDALVQERCAVAAYTFVSPPKSIVLAIFRSLLIERPGVLALGRRRRIDALAVLSAAEVERLASRRRGAR